MTKAKKAYAKNVVEATIHKEEWVRSKEKHGKLDSKLRGKLKVLGEVAARQESLNKIVTDQSQSVDEIVSEFQTLMKQRKEDKIKCESSANKMSSSVETNIKEIGDYKESICKELQSIKEKAHDISEKFNLTCDAFKQTCNNTYTEMQEVNEKVKQEFSQSHNAMKSISQVPLPDFENKGVENARTARDDVLTELAKVQSDLRRAIRYNFKAWELSIKNKTEAEKQVGWVLGLLVHYFKTLLLDTETTWNQT